MQVMIMAGLVLPVDAQKASDQVLGEPGRGGGGGRYCMGIVSGGGEGGGCCWTGLA